MGEELLAIAVVLEVLLLIWPAVIVLSAVIAEVVVATAAAVTLVEMVSEVEGREECWVRDVCPRPVVSVALSVVATRVLVVGPPMVTADDDDAG